MPKSKLRKIQVARRPSPHTSLNPPPMFLQNTASTMLRMALYLWLEPREEGLVFPLECPEPDPLNVSVLQSKRRARMQMVLDYNLSSPLMIEAETLLINTVNYTLEVLAAIGDDQVLRTLIVLINLLSPHRFSSSSTANLLATLTPLNAVLFQFLRQYIRRKYPHREQRPLNADGGANTEYSRIFVSSDTAHLVAFGHHVPAFEQLRLEDRERLASFLQYPPISSRVHLQPNWSHADWLFAFCVAALNDPRVDEVSQRDYSMKIASSKQYTPLILELLSNKDI